eukprot:COSAG02_NODE_16557_length_1074_cov_2.915897_1_plen_51_part_00
MLWRQYVRAPLSRARARARHRRSLLRRRARARASQLYRAVLVRYRTYYRI